MAHHAKGTFEIKLTPVPSAHTETPPARMSIDKQFQGDIEGTSQGEMLSALTAVKGSAGYVAIEKVTATLHGRKGTFVLQHSGTMNKGAQSLTVTVVPDSGTDELTGLSGTFNIEIKDGKHFYSMDYTI